MDAQIPPELGPRAPQRKLGAKFAVAIGVCFLVVLVNALWIFGETRKQNVTSEIKALRDAGFPTTWEELRAEYPNPEDYENAANSVLGVLDRLDELDPNGTELDALWETRSEYNELGDYSLDFLSAVSDYEDDAAIEVADLGSYSPDATYRYPIEFSQSTEDNRFHLDRLRRAARLLLMSSERDYMMERSERALEKHLGALTLAFSLREEPSSIGQAFRTWIEVNCADSLCRLISYQALPAEMIPVLQSKYGQIQQREIWRRTMLVERCVVLNTLKDIVGPEGGQFNAEIMDARTGWDGIPGFLRSFVLANQQEDCLDAFGKWRLTSESDWTEILSGNQRVSSLVENLSGPSSDLVKPLTLGTILFAKAEATTRMVVLALAIEQFRHETGSLPDAFANLQGYTKDWTVEDPFVNEPLRFAREPQGYVVYSVYTDRTDDGGRPYTKVGNLRYEGDWALRVRR